MRDDEITEADLKAAIRDGKPLRRVVVVVLGPNDYQPWVRLAGHPRYQRLAIRHYRKPRNFTDFDALRRTFAKEGCGYSGAVHVYPQGHRFLSRLGIEA